MNILRFGLGDKRYNSDPRLRALLSMFRGRPSGQLAGTFVSEMAGLRKVLYLCHSCINKFSERRFGYRRAARPPLSRGCIADCDDCRTKFVDCVVLLPEEQY